MKIGVKFIFITLIIINVSAIPAVNHPLKPKLPYTKISINLADAYIHYDKGYYYLITTGNVWNGLYGTLSAYRSCF